MNLRVEDMLGFLKCRKNSRAELVPSPGLTLGTALGAVGPGITMVTWITFTLCLHLGYFENMVSGEGRHLRELFLFVTQNNV